MLENSIDIRVARKPDRERLTSFFEVLEGMAAPVNVLVLTSIQREERQTPDTEQLRGLRALLADSMSKYSSERILRMTAAWKGESRGDQLEFRLESDPKQFVDVLTISGAQASRDAAGQLLAATNTRFQPQEWAGDAQAMLPEAYRAYASAVESTLASRAGAIDNQFGKLLALAESVATAVTQRAKETEDAAARRRKEVEDEVASTRSLAATDIENAKAAAAERARELDRREAEVERRDPRAVRKALQHDMRKLLEQHRDFAVSDATQASRMPVHIASLIAGVVAAGLYALVAWRITDLTAPTAVHVGIMFTASAFLGITVWFYLRFLAGWFRKRAEAEGGVRALTEDFLRAQWLVEIMFEWKTERSGESIPWNVLRRLSHGLFTRTPDAPQLDHPLDGISARTSSVREIRVGPRGARVAFQRGGRRRNGEAKA